MTPAGSTAGGSIPIITTFDPTNETEMRALCKTWTEGSPAVFAVLDGLGDWTGDDQLCITQEGHTPFLGAWTTVTDWTNEGSPYLWWIGPDQATILQAVVNWGLSAHLIGGTVKVGIIAGNRASDQAALNELSPARPATGRRHPDREDHRRRPQRHRHHRHPGPPGHPAAPQRRRHLGHPPHPLQRVLPGAPGRDRPAVLPQAAPQRLRVEHPVVARAHPRSLRQGAQRPGGGDHRDPGWHRRPPPREPGRLRPRRAQAAGRSGTRPIPRYRRGT